MTLYIIIKLREDIIEYMLKMNKLIKIKKEPIINYKIIKKSIFYKSRITIYKKLLYIVIE
mgnify:CR=1 FL=1